MRLHFCISNEKDMGFMVKKSYTSFSTFILPLLNETIVLSRKTHTPVSKMTLCIKAVINMEDNVL